MTTIQSVYQQAELAEAAYASLHDERGVLLIDPDKIWGALVAEGMSKSQATAFLDRWKLVSQYSATNDGFSATLFQSRETGEYAFAIRGTLETLPDLFGADFGDLVMDGLPMDQIVDMYNYFQSLRYVGQYQAVVLETDAAATEQLRLMSLVTTPEGSAKYAAELERLKNDGAIIDVAFKPLDPASSGILVRRIRFGGSSTLLAGTALAQGSGVLGGTPGFLNVTGHSLGGNLAAAFTRLFPNINAQAITINGAGFPTGSTPGFSGNAAANIHNLFSKLGGADAFDAARIQNVVGDGAKMVSMDSQYGLVQPGKPQLEIFLESHTERTQGHFLRGDSFGHGSRPRIGQFAWPPFAAGRPLPRSHGCPPSMALATNIHHL